MAGKLSESPPLASVLLPAFNAADTVFDTIQSVLSQSFPDFELIIIDDGSRDETRKIIESFTDPRIRFIHRANAGLVKTLNEALALSRGTFILRIDADDIAHPTRFQEQVSFLQEHPELGVLGTQASIIDDSGHRVGRAQAPVGVEAIRRFAKHACPVAPPHLLRTQGDDAAARWLSGGPLRRL